MRSTRPRTADSPARLFGFRQDLAVQTSDRNTGRPFACARTLSVKRLLGLSPEDCNDSGIASGAYCTGNHPEDLSALAGACLPDSRGAFSRHHRRNLSAAQSAHTVPAVGTDRRCALCHSRSGAPDTVLRERIVHRNNTQRDASEATLAVLQHQQEIAEPISASEQPYTSSWIPPGHPIWTPSSAAC